ncbi:response regulator [Halioxenophilus aromaticivorans]|uniref:Response regulator n=1 Tax=Halioxenophilus aromaticivorans TaxID=1306992 RepID=A0AAV3TW06_9ALTE
MAFREYHKLRILILDDFDGFRSTVARMLEDFGVAKVDGASNAEDAQTLCEQWRYDAILSDYNLGNGATGLQLLESLRFHRRLDSRQIFVLVSAENSKEIVLAASDVEPDAYLSKPITAKTLQQRLDRILVMYQQLQPLLTAMDNHDTAAAISACRDHIRRRGYQSGFCQKYLANLLLEAGDLGAAEQVYRSVLQVRPLEWARLGMAKIRHLQGDLDMAKRWFQDLITVNPLNLKAYDGLADVLASNNDGRQVQATLQSAVSISPLALLRQERLADTAVRNQDFAVAVKALRRVIRLAEHSVYKTPQQNLNYARSALSLNEQLPSPEALKDAVSKLKFLEAPSLEQSIALQSKLLQAQLMLRSQDVVRGEQMFHEACAQVQQTPLCALPFEVAFETIKAQRCFGKQQEAEELLQALCEQHKNDQEKLEQLDLLLDEPKSTKNKSLIARFNSDGIRHYQRHAFTQAAEAFAHAQALFPSHVGVRLNLLQVLLAQCEADDVEPGLIAQVDEALDFVSQKIHPTDGQYRRYIQLKEKRQKCALSH